MISNAELARQITDIIAGKVNDLVGDVALLKTQVVALKGENEGLRHHVDGQDRVIAELVAGMQEYQTRMETLLTLATATGRGGNC